jgi:hypothetical protein
MRKNDKFNMPNNAILKLMAESLCSALPYKDSIMVEGEAERFQQNKPHTFDKPHLL